MKPSCRVGAWCDKTIKSYTITKTLKKDASKWLLTKVGYLDCKEGIWKITFQQEVFGRKIHKEQKACKKFSIETLYH